MTATLERYGDAAVFVATCVAAAFSSLVMRRLLSVLPVRGWIIEAVRRALKLAMTPVSIGLFVGIIALQNAGSSRPAEATMVTTGDLTAPALVLVPRRILRHRGPGRPRRAGSLPHPACWASPAAASR